MKTKKDYFTKIIKIISNSDDIEKNELIYFLNTQIASIDKKAEGAKKRREKNKEIQKDNLKEEILNTLSFEYFSNLTEIKEKLSGDPSQQKIVSRLTQLKEEGLVERDSLKINDKIWVGFRRKRKDW